MNRVGDSRGFTIVETVIFLAVSSAMFISAMLLMSGQQSRTEFRQAVGETQSLLDDVTNNVATGYYRNPGTIKCAVSGSNPPVVSVSGSPTAEGANLACLFFGQTVQFRTDAPTTIRVYTMAARRLTPAGAATQNLAEALPVLIATNNTYDTQVLPAGLSIYRAFSQDGAGTKTEISGFAVTSSLASYASGVLSPGGQSVNIVPIVPGNGQSASTYKSTVDAYLRTTTPDALTNPANGVYACISGSGTDQHFILRIGRGRSLASEVDIKSGPASSDPECQP